MKQRLDKRTKILSLTTHNAQRQAMIAILLLMIVPSLSMFYVGMTYDKGHLTFPVLALILVLTILIARLGFIVLRKFPDNIIKLRQYIAEVAEGALPEKIALVDTQSSDDLMYIEENFNNVLHEMRRQIETSKKQFRREHVLRETVETQHQILIEAEQHRVMIQTLGAACHHIGQPATVLQLRLETLQRLATNQEEINEITGCVKAMQLIADILHQLQQVSQFRTVSYIHTENAPDEEILAIRSES